MRQLGHIGGGLGLGARPRNRHQLHLRHVSGHRAQPVGSGHHRALRELVAHRPARISHARDRPCGRRLHHAADRVAAARAVQHAEVQRTTQLAEDARTQALPYLALARRALDRLHSRWIENKADLLAGRLHLRGEVMCAFNSNFNITQSDPDYGVRQIWVMERLRHLERRMSTAVAYACDSESSDVCASGNTDTVAYVRDHRPPIHFCVFFRDDPDQIGQQATVIHEYAHLLPGCRRCRRLCAGRLGRTGHDVRDQCQVSRCERHSDQHRRRAGGLRDAHRPDRCGYGGGPMRSVRSVV